VPKDAPTKVYHQLGKPQACPRQSSPMTHQGPCIPDHRPYRAGSSGSTTSMTPALASVRLSGGRHTPAIPRCSAHGYPVLSDSHKGCRGSIATVAARRPTQTDPECIRCAHSEILLLRDKSGARSRPKHSLRRQEPTIAGSASIPSMISNTSDCGHSPCQCQSVQIRIFPVFL
jgi:hypothetical protein